MAIEVSPPLDPSPFTNLCPFCLNRRGVWTLTGEHLAAFVGSRPKSVPAR
jgi:hypothetical protein